jgi:hypothetical protein
MTLAIPTIHLNGTSRQELIDQLSDAAHALEQAIEQVCKAAPNSRDYYPQGNAAFGPAQDQHYDRIDRIRKVRDELIFIAEASLT